MYKIGIKSYLLYLTEVLLFNRKRFNKCLNEGKAALILIFWRFSIDSMLIYLIAAKHIVYQVQCEEY